MRRVVLALSLLLAPLARAAAQPVQGQLVPDTDIAGPTLTFDWPAVRIGIASYEAGPTGVTVFHFPARAAAAVDVRGGAPGTVNTDALRLAYPTRFTDAIVFAGGSGYGEEAITAVAAGLKQDGLRGTRFDDMAIVSGAAIYDFLGHRMSEIYPDHRLGLAALHAERAGVFPLGAQGAGRMAMQGGAFGCAAHSGQGGAFRQIGALKIAAFTVVNASGAVTDRAGRPASCHRDPAWGDVETTAELIRHAVPYEDAAPAGPTHNTTLSLVLTNRRLSPAALQRLAVQVHTSMARGIQPFSTFDDGDTLFAASTGETDRVPDEPDAFALNEIAAEVMWDAILASVPADPPARFGPDIAPTQGQLDALAGRYQVAPNAVLRFARDGDRLTVRMQGYRYFDVDQRARPLHASSERALHLESRTSTRFAFTLGADGRAASVTVNPGRWEETGTRIGD